MNCTIEYIKNWLKANLNEERYEHSLGTAECAEELARKYDVDPGKAYFTGLIHDCAKCMPKEEALQVLNDKPAGLPELACGELDNFKTYHAPIGVYVAKQEFGITDEEILSAIRWHTIGKLNMTDFEKVIYIADKIEKRTRPKEYIDAITEGLNRNGLDGAMLVSYKNTIKSLVDRNLTICTATIDIYNELLRKHS